MWEKYRYPLLAIVALHFVLFAFQARNLGYLPADSGEVLTMAENIKENQVFYAGDPEKPEQMALYTKVPPVYPAIIAVNMIFTRSLLPVLILQILLSIASVIMLLRIFDPGKHGLFPFILLLVLSPVQYIYANLVMSEILLQFVVMMAVYCFWLYIKYDRRNFLWLYQFLLVIGILIQTEFFFLVFPNILVFSIFYFRSKRRLVLMSSLLPLVFLIIFAGINQQRTGFYHLSSAHYIKLIDSNLFNYIEASENKNSAIAITEEIHQRCNTNSDLKTESTCYRKAFFSYIKEDFKSYSLYYLKKIGSFFIDPGRLDKHEHCKLTSILYSSDPSASKASGHKPFMKITLFLIVMFNVIRTVGFIFFLFNRNYSIKLRLLLFFLTGSVAAATATLCSSYMVPVFLIVTGSAIVQYEEWINALINKLRPEKQVN